MRRSLYSLLSLLVFFIQTPVLSQSQYRLKSFIPEVIQTAGTALITVRHALPSSELGIVVNTQDPQSVQVANYYKKVRGIPEANIIAVSFAPGSQNMVGSDINIIRADVLSRAPANVQAFAISWTTPWKVDCMSITSAFAFGYDPTFCQPESSPTCETTLFSNYYSSSSHQPRNELSIIPAMMLAGLDATRAQAVIDRGILSDSSFPRGDGYLLTTTDTIRSSRSARFSYAASIWNDPLKSLKITHIDNSNGVGSDYLENVKNILFYFTGNYFVPKLSTLSFVPGAVADHMTSYGGALTANFDNSQMSALRWLEAGATGSYGTVVEPCNYPAKFPDPAILFHHYFAGESLIESYWKSVAMPIEGLFIGDPLAKPWGTIARTLPTGEVEILTTSFKDDKAYYLLKQSSADNTLFDVVQTIPPQPAQFQTIKITPTTDQYYLLSQDEVYLDNNPPNLSPVESRSINEGKVLVFQLYANDIERDRLTFGSINLPSGATLDPSTGRFRWQPTYFQSGVYDVIFEVSDGFSTDSQNVSISVQNVNRVPTLSGVSNRKVWENRELAMRLVGKDLDNDNLAYSATNLPEGSTLDPSTGTFSWKPSFTQAGLYSDIQFTVSDGQLSSSRTISIDVLNTNRRPVLDVLDAKAVAEGDLLEFTLSSSDPDGDPVSYSVANLPPGASINSLNGSFSWTPSYTQAGARNLRFYVTDGKLISSVLVRIVVSNTNRAPVLSPIGMKIVTEGSALQFPVEASDPDGPRVVLSAAYLPIGASFRGSTRTFTWTPKIGQYGVYVVPITVSDGLLTAMENVTIVVVQPSLFNLFGMNH